MNILNKHRRWDLSYLLLNLQLAPCHILKLPILFFHTQPWCGQDLHIQRIHLFECGEPKYVYNAFYKEVCIYPSFFLNDPLVWVYQFIHSNTSSRASIASRNPPTKYNPLATIFLAHWEAPSCQIHVEN